MSAKSCYPCLVISAVRRIKICQLVTSFYSSSDRQSMWPSHHLSRIRFASVSSPLSKENHDTGDRTQSSFFVRVFDLATGEHAQSVLTRHVDL